MGGITAWRGEAFIVCPATVSIQIVTLAPFGVWVQSEWERQQG